MMKTLVLLTVLLSLTITTANVSVMAFNRNVFPGFKDASGSAVRQNYRESKKSSVFIPSMLAKLTVSCVVI